MITPTEIKQNEQIRTYIEKADEALAALGYTEHSYAHVTRVAHFAEKIMADLGYPRRMQELAWIAGYMHDIGNVINRIDHAQSGAVMAFRILDKLGMPADEIATVCSAIGNHDESTAFPVNAVAAALILADKTDVRRTRVRNRDKATFDIHDRVNYAVEKASTRSASTSLCSIVSRATWSASITAAPRSANIRLRVDLPAPVWPVRPTITVPCLFKFSSPFAR